MDVEIHLESESILYTTLLLFVSTVVVAITVDTLAVWWAARRGRDDDVAEPAAPASGTG